MRRLRSLAALVGVIAAAVSRTSIAEAQSARIDAPLDTVRFAADLNVDLAASRHVARGLYSRDVLVGTGRVASRGDELTVRYFGRLTDGRAFTATSEPPATFKLGTGTVIAGWERGLSGMRVGGIRQLVVAPELGYGKKGSGPIPPNAVLVFDVELVSVK